MEVTEPLSPLIKQLYDKVKISKEKRTIVAIDIGVTHTRYAYTTERVFLKEAVDESLEITPWHQGHTLDTEKVFREPTSIVLNNEHQCVALGIKAEDMIIKEKHTNEELYFHRFMGQLFTSIRECLNEATNTRKAQISKTTTSRLISDDKHLLQATYRSDQNPSVQGPSHFETSAYVKTPIKDIYGKTADVVDILGAFLRTLIDKILEHIKLDTRNKADPETVRWVFTYPHILKHAEMIIHKCTQKAGISYSNVYIFPEVEAASLCCQNRLDSIYGITEHMTTETKTFLVVFLGDFASYCILHKTLPTGQIDSIDKAVEDFGECNIYEYFFEVLSEILQGDTLEVLQQQKPNIYVDIFRNFEKLKNSFCSNTSNSPYVLRSYNKIIQTICGKDIGTLVQLSKYSGQIEAKDNDLVLKHEFWETIYKQSLHKIESLILTIVGKATHIFLIGSLSESRFIQSSVQKRFHNVKVIVPENPSCANLEGSVIYAAQQQEQWFTAKFGCPVQDCEGHQKNWSWMCMQDECRSPLLISSWGNLKCEKDSLHGDSICFWKFQCGLHEKKGADLKSLTNILLNSRISYFKSARVLNCLNEKLKAQRTYVRQNPVKSKDEFLAIERGSMDDAGEQFVPLVLRCPVDDCPREEKITWKCVNGDCNSFLQVSNWGHIKCQRKSKPADCHQGRINSWRFECGSHDKLPANLITFDKLLFKSQSEKELWPEIFQSHLKLKLQTQRNQPLNKVPHRRLLAVDNKWFYEEKWINLKLGCQVDNCRNKDGAIVWKCMTNGCTNPLRISNKGNIKCIPTVSNIQHTCFITKLMFRCDFPDHRKSIPLQLHELANILISLQKTADFDLSEINPLSKKNFIDSLKTAIQPHSKGHEFLEKKPNLDAIDEDMLVAEDWVVLKSGCVASVGSKSDCSSKICYRSKTIMNWKCMTKEKEACRSQLYISNYGNLKCGNSDIEKPHTGALWHWEFFCDMHDNKMVDLERAVDILTKSKSMKDMTKDKPTFLYTLKSKIRKEIQRQKDEQYKTDEVKKVAFRAMDEESEKEYPFCWGHNREPPNLIDDGEITEKASVTIDTVFLGAEHICSRLILKDSVIHTDILTSAQDNAKKMKTEIISAQVHLQNSTSAQVHMEDLTSAQVHIEALTSESAQVHMRTPNNQQWNKKGRYNMFNGFAQLTALYDAIDCGDYMKMLTIFYQSQHKHVLKYATERQDVGIILNNDEHFLGKWKEAITDSMEQINDSAPGLHLSFTNHMDQAKIEITQSDDSDKCFTDINAEIAKIVLDQNLPTEQMCGTAIRELLYALGFLYEMQRYDAKLQLLINESDKNKDIYETKCYAMLTRFDPFSVMMYPETKYLSRTGEDPIWSLKSDKDQRQTMSELDKVALNLVYPPCITHLFNPRLNPTYQMLYCGRKVMSLPNQASESNTPSESKCGPNRWSNCPACRVIKEIEIGEGEKTEKIEKIYTCIGMGKWQGMSGVFYCGKRHSIRKNVICGPDEGLPCTDCGKMLDEEYDYEKVKKSEVCAIL